MAIFSNLEFLVQFDAPSTANSGTSFTQANLDGTTQIVITGTNFNFDVAGFPTSGDEITQVEWQLLDGTVIETVTASDAMVDPMPTLSDVVAVLNGRDSVDADVDAASTAWTTSIDTSPADVAYGGGTSLTITYTDGTKTIISGTDLPAGDEDGLSAIAGTVTNLEYQDAGGGTLATVDYSGTPIAANNALAAVSNAEGLTIISMIGEGDNTIVTGPAAAGNGVELAGGAGDDDITGSDSDDLIDGGAGADTIDSGAGFDLIGAGSGDDTLTSGTGFDVLSFGGYDSNGDPQIDPTTDIGQNTVTDFSQLNPMTFQGDLIDLGGHDKVGGVNFTDLVITSDGTDTTITAPTLFVGQIVLENFDDDTTPLLASDFNLACFPAGTLIKTKEGERSIETLRAGDNIETLEGTFKPLRFVGVQTYKPHPEHGHLDRFLPIKIKKDALGTNMPCRDLITTWSHAIMLEDDWFEQKFGERNILVPAGRLINGDTISQVQTDEELCVYMLMFDAHEVVFAEGAPVESYRPSCNNHKDLDNSEDFPLKHLEKSEMDARYPRKFTAVKDVDECRIVALHLHNKNACAKQVA